MRIILYILVLTNLLFANILSSKEAFKITHNSDENGIYINIKIANNIYLYKNKIKLILNDKDITNSLNMPKSVEINGTRRIYDSFILFIPSFLIKNKNNKLTFFYQGCTDKGLCYQPLENKYNIIKDGNNIKINILENLFLNNFQQNNQKISKENYINKLLKNENLFVILLVFFGYGLLLSLTPCTLPMVPILSSIIIAKSNNKPTKIYSFYLSFIYVFFMSLAYALAGILAAYLGFSVQGILQKPIIIISFSIIFVILALAMFEVFNFQISNKFQNLLEQKIKKQKGVVGIAIMGFLSALIIGPCVAAPLSGALIYIANTKDIFLGGSALFVMSFGMGIPLLLVGFGIGFLKTGIWMEKIKILFGFIMLIMAIWILSRILKENYILMLYGILGVFFVVYFGIFDNINKFLKAILILLLSYSISIFLGGLFGGKDLLNPFDIKNYQKQEKLNFTYINDLNSLEKQINSNKKLLVYFTAKWCENCKLLEETTFKNSEVIKKLQNYKLIKIDITNQDDNKNEIIKKYNIFGPPVMILFENKKCVEKIVGYVNYDDFIIKIN